MRLRVAALVLVWTITLVRCESQLDVEEDEWVLKELGLFEEDDLHEGQHRNAKAKESTSMLNEHRTLRPRGQPEEEEHGNEPEHDDDPWDLYQPREDQAEAEDDVEGKVAVEGDNLDQHSGDKSFKQSLEDEFVALREKHNSNFFEGALEYLERIVLQTRSDPRAVAGPMSVLGFHYIRRNEYEQCASTFEGVDEVMGEVTDGPGLLMEFCALMSNDATSLDNLRKAVPLLRSAIVEAKRELEDERAQVLIEHLTMLSRRLAEARGDANLGAAGIAQRSAHWYVEGLETAPLYNRLKFPGAMFLEERFETIRAEVDAFLAGPSVSIEMRPMGEHTGGADAMLVTEGRWTDVSLYKGGVRNKRVCKAHFPKTCDIIESGIPEAWTNNFCQVVISRLDPGTETRMHQGGTNAQLTVHLGLKAPQSAGLQVGDEILQPGWSEGKTIVFDDSFEHQVWHRGDTDEGPRIVLVLRIWHPSFTLRERLNVIEQDAFKMGSKEVKKRRKYLKSVEATQRYEALMLAFRNKSVKTRVRSRKVEL